MIKKISINVILIYIFNLSLWAIENNWHNLINTSKNLRYTKEGVVFTGNKKDNIYINGEKNGAFSWNYTKNKNIEFNFKYNKEYLFMISVNTTKGHKTLMYLAKNHSTKTYIGLGEETINGKWQTVTRNVEEDLRQLDPTNHLLSINAFICRGEGEFGKIKLFNAPKKSSWKNLYHTNPVKTIYDKEKKHTLFSFQDKTGKESYIYRFQKEEHHNAQKISWEFKYKKDFVILVSINTQQGYKTLIYTSNKESHANYIGLGDSTQPNQWNQVTRDLKEDLERLSPNSQFLSINAFIYRGEGLFTNLKVIDNHKKYLNRQVLKTLFTQLSSSDSTCSSTPTLKLIGDTTRYHPLNQPYIDAGATAVDCNNIPLTVEVFNNIDTDKRGRYLLQYIASDRQGNISTEARVVIVGEKNFSTKHNLRVQGRLSTEPTTLEENGNGDVTSESDQVDEEYEAIREEVESALDGMEYQVGDEIVLDFDYGS